MVIKSIEIKNFRQFKDIKLNFSTDSNKNVSIVTGNNGAGKTTLAEAFTWCLYGEISNTKNDVLNKEKIQELKEGYSTGIVVTIELEHDGIEYRITRNQTFSKSRNGRITEQGQTQSVYKKLINGMTVPVQEYGIEDEIDKILPKNLSKYFFSSGERIDSMGKSLEKGGKSSEFSQAVKSLLGLAPFIEAKDHLTYLQKKYTESCRDNGDKKIIELQVGLSKYQKLLEKINEEIKEIESVIKAKNEEISDCSKELSKYEDSKKIQEELNEVEKLREKQEKIKQGYEKDIIKLINKELLNFISQCYIKKAKELLEKYDYADKDIPNLHSKTIDYLIKKGYCLCGHKIVEGSEEYKTLVKLKDDLPPNSIGISVNSFIKDSKRKISNYDFYEDIKDKYGRIKSTDDDILNYEDKIIHLKNKLSGKDVQNQVRELSNIKRNAEIDVRKYTEQWKDKLSKEGEYKRQIKLYEHNLENEYLKNEENRKILNYKKYVDTILEEITETLEKKERELRDNLEREVDKIFNSIYIGGLHISIDEKYNISTTENINISTGQSQAIILSFIAGIIKLAKINMNEDKDEIYTQAYPLVMDAPLSVFDKTVIKNICELIPNIAEQVIVFIKDTDGEIAEKYMQSKIGMKAKLIKINEHHTKIEE